MDEATDAPLEVEVVRPDKFDKALPVEKASDDKQTDYAPVAQYFGYDRPNDEEDFQLKYIWEHFSEGTKERGDTIQAIRAVERTLTAPEMGQSRLNKLYMYVRVLANISDAEKERKAYVKDPNDS